MDLSVLVKLGSLVPCVRPISMTALQNLAGTEECAMYVHVHVHVHVNVHVYNNACPCACAYVCVHSVHVRMLMCLLPCAHMWYSQTKHSRHT